MKKTLSYRGRVAMGEQDRITLSTINGKTGYVIKKFQLMSNKPGFDNYEFIGKITKVDQTGSITDTVNFTDSNLLAVAVEGQRGDGTGYNRHVIFDNEKFNQDIFVNVTDAAGNTVEANYYIELETMELSDLESTYLTLQSLRSISE
jgi:hypothetical protein